MFLDHPLGTGHRGTAVLSPMYMDEKWLARSYENGQVVVGRSSHNTFFTTLSEQGVVGVALFSALVVWVMMAGLKVFRLRNRVGDTTLPVIAAGLCGGVAVVLVAGIGTDYLMTEVQFWFLAGLVCALRLLAASAAVAGATSILAAAAPLGRPMGRLQAPH
jgi:O-antigen ligase